VPKSKKNEKKSSFFGVHNFETTDFIAAKSIFLLVSLVVGLIKSKKPDPRRFLSFCRTTVHIGRFLAIFEL
jgi:hypothetical protein